MTGGSSGAGTPALLRHYDWLIHMDAHDLAATIKDRQWFHLPLDHAENIRQFTYWLNFKRPHRYRLLHTWMESRDSAVSQLRPIVERARGAAASIRSADTTPLSQMLATASEFLAPDFHIKNAGIYYNTYIKDTNAEDGLVDLRARAPPALRQSLPDVHSKVSFLYDESSVVALRQQLVGGPPTAPLDAGGLSRSGHVLRSHPTLVSFPAKLTPEDAQLVDGMLCFTRCVLFLMRELPRLVSRIVAENEFHQSGLVERMAALRHYRSPFVTSGPDGDRRRVKLPDFDWSKPPRTKLERIF